MSRALEAVVETVRDAQSQGTAVRLSSAQVELLERIETSPQVKPVAWRYVRYGDEQPPKANVRIVGRFIETWTPDIRPGLRMDMRGYDVRQSEMELHDDECTCIGTVRLGADMMHEACGRKRINLKAYWNETEARPQSFGEHVASIHIQAKQDESYNGFYPTMKGDDVIRLPEKPEKFMRVLGPHEGKIAVSGDHYDVNGRLIAKGQVMRGGKEITGGRREYREHLKATRFEPVDSGYQAHVDRNAKARKAKQKRDIEHAAEKIAKKYFPMSGRIGEI